MINLDIIKSIFDNHSIDKVTLIEESNFITYILYNMKENLSLERWNHLEIILKSYTKKDVVLLPYNQAITHLDAEFLDKGVTI